MPKVWRGSFPYQVKVKQVIPKVTDFPKAMLKKLDIYEAVRRFDIYSDNDMADDLVFSRPGKATLRISI